MRTPALLLAVIAPFMLLTLAPAAFAEEDEESYANYFEFQAGANWVPNQSLGNGNAGSLELDEPGWHAGGAIGRQFTDLLRAELNISYRQGDLDQARFAGTRQADGKQGLTAIMINAYADLPMGPITPWVGFGIGGGEYKVDINQHSGGTLTADDADAVFVYNAMVGASVPVNEVTTLNFGYRYIAVAGKQEIDAVLTPGAPSIELETEFDAHEGIIGVRFGF